MTAHHMTSKTFETVLGSELKPGDSIRVWFAPYVDKLVSLTPYEGPLAYLFAPTGASLAAFACSTLGMTIEHGAQFERVIV